MLNMYSTVDSFRFFLTHFVLIPEIVRLNFRYYLRISLGVFSAIAGLIFLSKSSFFAVQLEDTKSSKIFAFAVLSALLIFLVLAARSLNDILRKVWNLNVFIKAMVHCLFLGMVWLLAFLIKYPRFNVHSKYRKSCLVEQGNKDISYGSEFNLYAVGAFALLALLLSWKRHKSMKLGFFGILIGLIMDASMEIPVDNDTPNLWYLFGAFLYCIGLIFIRRYINHAKEEGRAAGGSHRRLSNVLRNSLEFFSAIVGVVCLFLSPFCKLQFEKAENVKAVCFITFSLILGALLFKAPTFIDILAERCHKHFAVKTIVNFFFLMVISGVIFMTKYPRFKINSKYFGESCEDVKGKKLASLHGNEFDMYSAGAFSLFALTISSERRQPMKLDIFAFLLELTMDTSIEVLGKGGQNFFYMPCAAIYCVLLILVRTLMDSSIERRGGSDIQLHKIIIGLDGGETRAIGDDQSLILRKSTNQEEKEHGLSRDGEIEGEEGDKMIISEDTNIDYEPPLGVVNGVRLSHLEDGLTQAFRRSKANKRGKAKREKERRRERRKEKESLWIL